MFDRRIVFLLVTSIGVRSTVFAQAPVVGIVRDDSTGQPLAGVEVTLEGRKLQTRTDAEGRFHLDAPSGTQFAVYRMLGFQEFRMRFTVKKDTVYADARLVRRAATTLPTMQVDAERRTAALGRDGFAERRAKGGGKFIDSVQLRAREDRKLSDVLAELTGVRLQEYRPTPALIEIRAVNPIRMGTPSYDLDARVYGRANTVGSPPCWVSVFFDGNPLYRSDRVGGQPPDFSRDFSVASLEAVEYYRSGAEVPQQYGGANANCGVILLWSRR